ncbi:MAG: cation transporter [Clostridiales bacterium]|nr:cation transporter [Clostridiales bacterium]
MKERMSSEQRSKRGKRAAVVGIAANAIMFAAKLLVGIASSSGAVLADSVNSLSDSVTGVVNYFGFYMSGKPADRDHPFGHGRIEYISSLIISGAIILAGYEFLVHSVKSIIDPKALTYELYMAVVLAFSVLSKIGMFIYFRATSKRIHSDSFRGASIDSLSDAGITTVTLIGLIVSAKTGWAVDGYIGVLVSVAVMFSGFSSAKSSVSYIIGKDADPSLVGEMKQIIAQSSETIGVHDVIVHDYGPGRQIASAHIEVSSEMSLQDAHRIADIIEEKIQNELNIAMTIHVDPVSRDRSGVLRESYSVADAIRELSGNEEPQNLEVKMKGRKCRIEFDLSPDMDQQSAEIEIQRVIRDKMKSSAPIQSESNESSVREKSDT